MFILSFEFVKMRWMKNFCYHSMWSMNYHVMFFVSWTLLLIDFSNWRNNNWKFHVDTASFNKIKKTFCEINRMRNRRSENFFMTLWLTNKIWNWNNKFTNRIFNWLKSRNDEKCNMIFEIAKFQWQLSKTLAKWLLFLRIDFESLSMKNACLKLETAKIRKSFFILHCKNIMSLILNSKLKHSQFEK